MSPRFVLGPENVPWVAEVVNRSLKADCTDFKGPVKLIKPVKIAHSFIQSVSNQFHVIILSLPM